MITFVIVHQVILERIVLKVCKWLIYIAIIITKLIKNVTVFETIHVLYIAIHSYAQLRIAIHK